MTRTATETFNTVGSFTPEQLPSLVPEALSARNDLNDALHAWYQTANEDVKQAIVANSHSLAAEVLPKNICKELDIHSLVPDNEGFYHPPTPEDALLLGNAWDVTQDNTTLKALNAAIDEIPPIEPQIEVQKELMREALEVATEQTNETFTSNYIKAITEEGIVDEDNTSSANVYLDMAPGSPSKAELGSITDPQYDERMERLVRPVGAVFLRATMYDGTTAIPAVHFRQQ